MQYFITFLEGIISFISPCMLPLLPVYVSYFGGGNSEKGVVVIRALSFIAGFSICFIIMGAGAGTAGALLVKHNRIVSVISGIIVVFLGLSYLGVFKIPFFKGTRAFSASKSVFSAFLFGIVYSVSLTPCIGAFLGSALMLASSLASIQKGILLLLCYSMGLGIPFFLSALILDKLKTAFDFVKRHYNIINLIAGSFLIIIGILMCTGLLNRFMALFS